MPQDGKVQHLPPWISGAKRRMLWHLPRSNADRAAGLPQRIVVEDEVRVERAEPESVPVSDAWRSHAATEVPAHFGMWT